MRSLDTQVLTAQSRADLDKALAILRHGGLVAVPTETVYGLAADAMNPDAVNAIFAAKERPNDHPLIVHIGSAEQLKDWAVEIPDLAYELAAKFWPGPLTLLLRKAPQVPKQVTAGKTSIGLRVPAHPALLTLLQQGKLGVAAPSANPYKRLSPTSAQQVFAQLQGKIDAVLDGGRCEVGVESTILDLTGDELRILREGPITARQIAAVANRPVFVPTQHDEVVPGNVAEHYQPHTPLYIGTREQMLTGLNENSDAIACVFYADTAGLSPSDYINSLPATKTLYAQRLYGTLYTLDGLQAKAIWIERPPQAEEWGDVNDRLRRAALPL